MDRRKIRRKLRTAQRVRREQGWGALARIALSRLSYPVLQARIRYVNAERGRPVPQTVQIEASSNCNLRCPSCSLSREVNPGRHLSPEELGVILDRLPFQPKAVSLNGIGEPLINPHFLRLVDILGERGIDCTFFTNGTLLVPHLREAILKRHNVSYVGISCDGARKETFEVLRLGAKFDTWKQFVKEFLAAAHGRAERRVETVMSSVVSRRNLGEVGEIVELAAELGFRSVQFADVMPNDEVAASLALTDADRQHFDLNALQRRGQELGVGVLAHMRRKKRPPKAGLNCFQPWEYMMISAEGDVLPCCAIVGSDKALVMGNILHQSFSTIWDGKEFQSFRRTSADGTNPLCSICPYY
ncbi:MAG TPA: radical SAM protein [Candidatus Acidoferrum sp.]|nr:radical SAM protein [Candidatus Acidoferrum sp.]